MRLPQEIIAQKRDGGVVPDEDIAAFVTGLTDGSINDAQAGAFAMAVLLKGLSDNERIALTQAMRDSGDVLTWDLPGPVVDKHSTGGVGDNVSLILAPALAACGAYVPMISGRGLGHTGGTLDKFDAIPGYNTNPDNAMLERVTRDVGCAIIGQTADIAPADKRLYAIRDVTGTVESIDLICASILSKKLAAGLGGLVLDVKVGTGAFMSDMTDATQLARTLCAVANGAGCKTTALITDMNAPLATAAGNALEVTNAVRLLRGDEIDTRLWDVTVALGGALLASSGLTDTKSGETRIAEALQSGKAAEIFGQMVHALGGPKDFVARCDTHLDHAPIIREILPDAGGFVSRIDARGLGMAVVELGGGRRNPGDKIDYAVGLDWTLGIGLAADAKTPLCRIHARTEDAADAAEARVRAAYTLAERPGPEGDLIKERIS